MCRDLDVTLSGRRLHSWRQPVADRCQYVNQSCSLGKVAVIVLGVSGAFGHDAAACLVVDGDVVAIGEEERFSRVKRAPGALPVNAIRYCLAHAEAAFGDVDTIAVSWNPASAPPGSGLDDYLDRLLNHDTWRGHRRPEVHCIDHHMAHAASSFLTSGFDEAAVLVMDGHGENGSTSLGHGKGDRLTIEQYFPIGDSLGHFFEAVSAHVGLGRHDAGKLMGLAAYGTPSGPPLVTLTDDGYRTGLAVSRGLPPREAYREVMHLWRSRLSESCAPRLAPYSWQSTDPDFSDDQRTLAATAQRDLGDTVVHLGRLATERCRTRSLVLAGGVALNCSANGRLLAEGVVDRLHIPPPAHDAGGALGAALLVAAARLDRPMSPYLGPPITSSWAREELRRSRLPFVECEHPSQRAADLLTEGLVVAWFQDRAEVGPRALGARSLVALPDSTTVRDRVNRIKDRELWRPLSPSMLPAAARRYCPVVETSPYMLLATQTAEAAYSEIPAVVHVDGTCRPQVVDTLSTPRFRELIAAVEDRIGCGVVLNTSLNGPDEPIVCTPADAIRFFAGTCVDALVVGDFVLEKR
ncbi:MAG: carbamoyltransferase family protein [Pseudonocardiaceae bacterium]